MCGSGRRKSSSAGREAEPFSLDLPPRPGKLPRMNDDHLDTLAASLGIALRPEWRAGVRLNYEVSLRLANELAGFPLDDEAELAPVYTP